MKNKGLKRALLLLVLVAVLATPVYAYMIHRSQTVANSFSPAKVSCKTNETFVDNEKTSITVTNTGNIDAYIRVRLVFYWKDSKGFAVARDMKPEINPNLHPELIRYDQENWIKGDGLTYYYKKPVAPGEATPNLLTQKIAWSSVKDETTAGVDYYYHPALDIVAEAIQSLPEKAAESAWNVSIQEDVITSVSTGQG